MSVVHDLVSFYPSISYRFTLRYRSPVSQSIVTMRFPGPSFFATCSDAQTLPPPLMPMSRAFLARQATSHRQRIFVLHGDEFVVHVAVEDAGHEAGADALDRVDAGLASGEHG